MEDGDDYKQLFEVNMTLHHKRHQATLSKKKGHGITKTQPEDAAAPTSPDSPPVDNIKKHIE